MTSVRRSLVISFVERYALIALSLASNVLIARLLSPEEIGLYSVTVAVIGIAQVLRDFGIGSFLVQQKDLTDEHIRTAFGMSLIIGTTLFLGFFIATPALADFYADRRLVNTLHLTALNFLVLPFCSISLSLLRRDMAFSRMLVINLVAALASFLVTIGLAYASFGPQALALGALAGNMSTGLGAWLGRKERRLLLPSLSEWRALLSFGGQNTVANVVTSIAVDINDIFVGKVLGFTSVAFISRAQGLMNLFHRDVMSSVRGVAFPAFARAHREGQDVEAQFIYAVTAVTAVAWPFYGFTSLYALELLRLLFGPQWDSAVPLVPVFCLAGAITATNSLISHAILAVGRVDLSSRAELTLQSARIAITVATVMIYKTIMACALAYLVCAVLAPPCFYAFKSRCIPNDLPRLLRHLGDSLKVSAACLALPAGVALFGGLDRTTPLGSVEFIAVGLATLVGWIIAVIMLQHPIARDPLFKRLFALVQPATSRPETERAP